MKEKLRVPHRLADRLVYTGFKFREDIIRYKKNNVSSSSRDNFSQAYKYVLFFSKNARSYADLDAVRITGNKAAQGRNKTPPQDRVQYAPENPDRKEIGRIAQIIHNSLPSTPVSDLPATSEVARAHGYDPEKLCPTCWHKFKRHATHMRIGDHRHYPIFASATQTARTPSNV